MRCDLKIKFIMTGGFNKTALNIFMPTSFDYFVRIFYCSFTSMVFGDMCDLELFSFVIALSLYMHWCEFDLLVVYEELFKNIT